MAVRLKVMCEVTLLLLVLLLNGLIASCSPAVDSIKPAETYKGPFAERPIVQQGEYWVYQLGNLRRVKTTTLPADVGFPLWLGKAWSYEGQATRVGQSPTGGHRAYLHALIAA